MENELWCASMKSMDKISQLQAVNYAEYCFCNKEAKHVRIGGSCDISSDDDEKLRLYNANPILKKHIYDPASPEYVVTKLSPGRIRMIKATDLAYTQIELPEK